MKRTLKAKQEYLKSTDGLFAIYAFKDGKRHAAYLGLGLIDAFEEIARRIAEDCQVLILLTSSDREITDYEIKNHCRVPFEYAKQFAVKPNFQGLWKLAKNM